MLVLAVLAIGFPWDGFWQVAAQPFATVLGGLAVLCGGALALYNGRETRDHDKCLAEQENNRVTALAAPDHERETVKELNARFSAAAIQLGDDKSAIRLDRKSDLEGKSVSGRVDSGGRSIIKTQKTRKTKTTIT